jgi:hypothetical protein
MNGFVASFAKTLSDRGVQGADVGRVMGYYNGGDLPVFDHLAGEFAVCDLQLGSRRDVAEPPVCALRERGGEPR